MFIKFKSYLQFYLLISVLAFTSNSLLAWLLMEINSFVLYSFLDKNNKYKKNYLYKYFLIQTVTSILILTALMIPNYMPMLLSLKSIIMLLGTIIKLGLMPFHMWMPSIIMNMSWTSVSVMLTTQKFWPLLFITNLNIEKFMFILILTTIASTLGSTFLIIQKYSMKWILTFSSIFHSSWMYVAWISMDHVGMLYLFVYSINMNIIIYFLKTFNINSSKDFMKLKLDMNNKLMLIWLFFTMSGFPPSSLFMIKITTVLSIINYTFSLYIIPLLLMTFSIMFSISYMMSINTLFFIKNKNFKTDKYYMIKNLTSFSMIFNMLMMYMIDFI